MFKRLSPDLGSLTLLCLSLAACAGLVALQAAWTGVLHYGFLLFNLFLASLPVGFSLLYVCAQTTVLRRGAVLLWLLFLPNSPYLITDLMHLRSMQAGPVWLEVLLVFSCAATGLALGYFSVMQIHRTLAEAGRPVLGWLVAFGALFLSGFGIYLGRFLRWHSIDAVRNPLPLLGDIFERVMDPTSHPRTWGVTLGFGLFLSLGYAFLVVNRGGIETGRRRNWPLFPDGFRNSFPGTGT